MLMADDSPAGQTALRLTRAAFGRRGGAVATT